LVTLNKVLVLLIDCTTGMNLFIIRFLLKIGSNFWSFIISIKFMDLIDIRIDVQSKAADQLCSLNMLTVYDNRAIFSDFALLRI